MNRRFVFRKTCQLSRGERDNLRALRLGVFGKDLTEEHFDHRYLHTPLGYSYHGLMIADGSIVGAYNVIPYEYNFFGTRVLFGLSVDTLITKGERGGPFNLSEMAAIVYEAMRSDSVGFIFGFPNEMAYGYVRRVLKWNDIGDLDFYGLPRRIGVVIPKLTPLNGLSRFMAAASLSFPWRCGKAEASYKIEKVQGAGFERHRYNGDYDTIAIGDGGKCVYRLYVEKDGVRVLYIIDVYPLRPEFLVEAVRKVYRRNARSADIMLYVGRLPFLPRPLFRVPASKRPRRVRMCGRVLLPDVVDDRVFQIANWNVNLSNFDVR
jgi:hypothetical protein